MKWLTIIIAKQNHSKSQLESIKAKYSKIIEKNEGEIVKIDDWGMLNLSYVIDENKKELVGINHRRWRDWFWDVNSNTLNSTLTLFLTNTI